MPHPQNGFPPATAGRLMVRAVPIVYPESTAASIERAIKKQAGELDSINYIYVVSRHHQLLGVFSMKELLRARPEQKAEDLMVREVHKVHPYTHQERAAYLALTYSIKAIPVVEKDGKFLGIVPSDALLNVMHREVSEDLLRLAGLRHHRLLQDDVLTLPLWRSVIHRLPWLYIGLAGALLIALIIQFFESTLQKNIILAAFIPLMVYMSSAVGTQLQVFMIRDIAKNHVLPMSQYLRRQLAVVLTIALLSSALLFIYALAAHRQSDIAFVMGLAMLMTISSSVVTGLLFPFIFIRNRLDPANASGPVGTIVQDMLSVSIYLAIATWLL